MGQPKATLEEMAEACQSQGDHVRGILAHYAEHYPQLPPDNVRFRQAFVCESAAHLLRVMATYETESRAFVAGLLKKYASESGR